MTSHFSSGSSCLLCIQDQKRHVYSWYNMY
uniref:Uncharacterized protein n=1 Tax=Anguilla anguilla TaxID=7936 RepID=A0A0E9VWF3_ANGAN